MENPIKIFIITIILIAGGISAYYFSGTQIHPEGFIKIQQKIPQEILNETSTMISVVDNDSGEGIANVPIYLDGKNIAQTKTNGKALILSSKGKHIIKLQGSAVLYENKEFSVDIKTSGDQIFKINKIYEHTVAVHWEPYDFEVNETKPLYNALVYVDDKFVGGTDVDGKIKLKLKKGTYKIKVEFAAPDETVGTDEKDSEWYKVYYGHQKPTETIKIPGDNLTQVTFYRPLAFYFSPMYSNFDPFITCLTVNESKTALTGDINVNIERGVISANDGSLSPVSKIGGTINLNLKTAPGTKYAILPAIQPTLDEEAIENNNFNKVKGSEVYIITIEIPTNYKADLVPGAFKWADAKDSIEDQMKLTYPNFTEKTKTNNGWKFKTYITPYYFDANFFIWVSKDGLSKCEGY